MQKAVRLKGLGAFWLWPDSLTALQSSPGARLVTKLLKAAAPLLIAFQCSGAALPAQDSQADALQQASDWIARGRYAEAEALLHRLLAASPRPEAHYLMGFTLIQLYRFPEAEGHLRQAVQADPQQPEWQHALAKSLIEQGRNRAALEVLARAVQLAPRAEYHFARAMCFLNLGDSPSAEWELRRCLTLQPAHIEALYRLGSMLIDRGDYQAAADRLRDCLKGNPAHLEARFALGLALSRTDRPQEAVSAFEAVLQEVPGHVGALYNLGRTLMQLGRRVEGRKRLEEFQAMSRLEDEIDFHRKAVRKNPSGLEGRLQLARLLLQAGYAQEALQQLAAAQRLSPRHARAYRLMAQALRRLGRPQEARQAENFARTLESQR